ncbi:ribosome maturation factor RimM, partial [Erwinia amylovora]|nr:ribosome maturation factor RimM [Erwinia amylovora]
TELHLYNTFILLKMCSYYFILCCLKVFYSTEDEEIIFDYHPWFIQRDGQWQIVYLEGLKRQYMDIIINVKGIDDILSACFLTYC